MGKNVRIWLILGATLFLVGSIILFIAMAISNWDFTKFSTTKYVQNEYAIEEEFNSISINSDTADLEFLPSNDGKTTVICYEHEKTEHSTMVKDGTLVITQVDNRKWYDYIGINFSTQKIKVYLSKTQYESLSVNSDTSDVLIEKDFSFKRVNISLSTGDVKFLASFAEDVKIETSTGDIKVQNLKANSLNCTLSTGDVSISNLTCEGDVFIKVSTGEVEINNATAKNLNSQGSTGDIELNGVILIEKLEIVRSTGEVEFDRIDAGEIYIKTSTGDVDGSILSSKVFVVSTDTGDKRVPNTVTGGKCEITTDTGDISVRIVGN